ncbi:DUF1772 domain-containing protein [Maribacter sp. HTCC2170]|uniref:anthrone oxygenase family protein n=1 Tax=Maribacter sp. (strain HTCC2170 / KCCM 42371) TaxID=313603 RepID=UPI00006B2109|nr:DUF1772 domain-containing protein [Maribacter sp. HTCC2170]EAR00060.1 probable integral-membrane protein [Maribacter sp. HTCC2170]
MDFTLENIALVTLVLLTGLSAGLCFTWTNSVTPGIGRLNDFGYLQSFQHMNRAILNPVFFAVFFGPFFLNLISIYLFKSNSNHFLWLLIIAGVLYFFGVLVVTVFGNVPLNEMLNKIDLGIASIDELRQLREKFEVKWNRLHSIRTLTSIISFLLLIISISLNIKQ